jgi:hypothetical protein
VRNVNLELGRGAIDDRSQVPLGQVESQPRGRRAGQRDARTLE